MQELQHYKKITDHGHQDAYLKNGCWDYDGSGKRLWFIASWGFHTTVEGSKDRDAANDEMVGVKDVILKFFELFAEVEVP